MSHLHGWPSLERDAKSFAICETFTSCFLPFFVRTEEILAVGVSKWYIMGKKTGLPNFRKAGLSWINQIILWATAEVYPQCAILFPASPFLFWTSTEGTGRVRRKWEMNNIPWGHLKPSVLRECLCLLTRLPASWFYLLSIRARFRLNCNPMEMGKGVSSSPNIFEPVFPFSFSSLITVSHICQSAPYPCCFCPDKHLIWFPDLCMVLGSEQSARQEFNFAASSDLRQCSQ